MTHHIRTSYGDSTTYAKKEEKFHGILQGNGAGPTIWAMVSTHILNSLSYAGYGAEIKHPVTCNRTVIPAFAFVDDTDLIQTMTDDSHTPMIGVQHAL
jgi:hypothetical protein